MSAARPLRRSFVARPAVPQTAHAEVWTARDGRSGGPAVASGGGRRHAVTVKAQPRLWTADFVLTLLGTFSFFGSFFYLISVLPDYIDHIGGSKWQVGLIVGGFSVVPIVLRRSPDAGATAGGGSG